jgi:hypothetical protein
MMTDTVTYHKAGGTYGTSVPTAISLNEDKNDVVVVQPTEVMADPSHAEDIEAARRNEELRNAGDQTNESERPNGFWFSLFVSTILCCAVYGVSLYLVLRYVFLDKNGISKPFKPACFSMSDMKDHTCFFSAGVVSYGIISFGEVSVGIFTLGQVSVGLAAAIGQAAIGWGWSFGQVAGGWYVPLAQLGIGLYRARTAQLAVQVLYSINPRLFSFRVPEYYETAPEIEDPISSSRCSC